MHSDHGFERLDKNIYVNYALKEKGVLKFKDSENITLKNISGGTKAFALDPARIYLNMNGKYPCGTVQPDETEDILCQLEGFFGSLEVDGKKVVRSVYRKAEIYSGPYIENAPDLVLVGEEGFNLKANIKTQTLADNDIFTGKHTQDTAFLILRGIADNSIIPDVPEISDIKSIVENNESAFTLAK